MTTSNLYRIAGLGLVVGAALFIVHVVLRSMVTAGVDPTVFGRQGAWVPINLLGLLGAVLILLGLPLVCAASPQAIGRMGVVGVVLIAAAWTFFGVFLSLYAVLLLPWLAEKAPSLVSAGTPLPTPLVVAFLMGLIAWVAGVVLLAIPLIRGGLRLRWAGGLLLASGCWTVLGNLVLAPSGPSPNLIVNLISNLAPVLLLVGLGHIGYLMWIGRFRRDADPTI